jgi:hypothetical protein
MYGSDELLEMIAVWGDVKHHLPINALQRRSNVLVAKALVAKRKSTVSSDYVDIGKLKKALADVNTALAISHAPELAARADELRTQIAQATRLVVDSKLLQVANRTT